MGTKKLIIIFFGLLGLVMLTTHCAQTTNTKNSHINTKVNTNKINGLSFEASPKKVDSLSAAIVIANNANWVSVIPFAFMKTINDTAIAYDSERQWYGETTAGIKEAAIVLKEAGIKVMIKPQIWIGRGSFTGNIVMNNEQDWHLFEKNYEAYILNFAQVAEETKADLLCIGTELNSFVTARPAFWNVLIAKIKKTYKGEITYAENWDKYTNVHFWKEIDYVGIDAYFPLSENKIITENDAFEGWKKHKPLIKQTAEKYKKQILFTEYGYRSTEYNCKEPWANTSNETNFQNQALAYSALYKTFWQEKYFTGGFIWKWYDRTLKRNTDNDFTPQGKPAQEVMKQFYKYKTISKN
jgi:hypothetical protein